MKNSLLVWGSVVLGAAFVALAVVYWRTPAGSLPTFIPGYQAGSMTIHVKHGIGSLLLGLGLWVFAWFSSGKKSSTPKDSATR